MATRAASEYLAWGDVGGFRYLTSSRLGMGTFLNSCREVLNGRVVWITSFDSGPLALSEEERASGWSTLDGVAVSPAVGPGVKLPYDNHDEWWIDVQDHTALRGAGLCSHGLFALAGLASREDAADSSWDLASMHDSIAELQQRFWTSFWQSKAQMYVADGDLFNFVCRDRIIFNRVLALASA